MLTLHDLCVYMCLMLGNTLWHLHKMYIGCHLELFVNVETLLHAKQMLLNIKPQKSVQKQHWVEIKCLLFKFLKFSWLQSLEHKVLFTFSSNFILAYG